MQVENYDVMNTLNLHTKVNEKGEKVVPLDVVKYILRYYFNYPVRGKRIQYFMERNVNGDISVRTVYPDKTKDLSIDVGKRVLFDKMDAGTYVERAAIYKAIEEIATQIGLALINKDQVKLYVMTRDDPDMPLDDILQAIVKARFMFNAYQPDSDILDEQTNLWSFQTDQVKKMVSEIFEEKRKEYDLGGI